MGKKRNKKKNSNAGQAADNSAAQTPDVTDEQILDKVKEVLQSENPPQPTVSTTRGGSVASFLFGFQKSFAYLIGFSCASAVEASSRSPESNRRGMLSEAHGQDPKRYSHVNADLYLCLLDLTACVQLSRVPTENEAAVKSAAEGGSAAPAAAASGEPAGCRNFHQRPRAVPV